MEDIYIVGASRTAIGSFGGTLSSTSPVELSRVTIVESLKRAEVSPDLVDEVFLGCVLTGGLGQNVARQSSMASGIDKDKIATTINIVCGSGLKAINMGMQSIFSGDNDIVVAGGTENMSMSPYMLPGGRYGMRLGDGKVVDSVVKDGLTCAIMDYHMGITAENVSEKYNISREAQDEFSVISHKRAAKAIEDGRFKDEIAPVEVKQKKATIQYETDEFVKPSTNMEALSKLRPAFKTDGTVTAGNASGINDGAAAIILASERKVKELNLKPLARIAAYGQAGIDPSIMGIGPVNATKKALKKAGWGIGDLDLIEANEAFASQAIAVCKLLDLNTDIVNVNGGAISLGHPIGASGARILVTLLYEMANRDVKKGLATLCVGGGMGIACLVERV